jgi:hypothetical protein
MRKELKYNRTVYIGEHEFIKPELPKNTSEILFYDKPTEEAYWKRLELPKVFYDFVPNFTELDQEATLQDEKGLYKSFNREDSKLFIDTLKQELHRRENGVFFRNGNEIEYITNHHYFTLQHCKVYGKDTNYEKYYKIFGNISRLVYSKLYMEYGYFYKYQRDLFYLIEKVCKNDECLGGFFSKAKKTGVTFLFACYKLNKTTLYKMQQIGIMSKKQDDAIDTNMMYFFHAYEGLPNIFKPNIQTLAKAQGEIVFGAKTFTGISPQKAALNNLMHDKALNSRVFTAPTKPKGFDAPKMSDVELDEFNKMLAESHESPKEIFDTNKATVKMQDDITGKMWLFGYVSEQNDTGVEEARVIFFDSKLSTKKGGKRTKSELICYHISSLNSYLSLIDKYGDCNEKEANNRIEEALSRCKNDPKTYQSTKRQLARNEREAWEVGGTKSVFNVLELIKHKYDLEQDLLDSPGNEGRLGYFKWENELWEIGRKDRRPKGQFCPVKFVEFTEEDILDGVIPRCQIFRDIPERHKNASLKNGRDEQGNLLPPSRFDYLGGVDPTKYAAGEEVLEGSKNGSYTINFHDELLNSSRGIVSSKILIHRYFYRPGAAYESYEDILKEIIYYGKLVIVEANEPYIATRLIEEGLGYYMIIRDKEKILRLWEPWMRIGEDFNLIKRTANADQNELLETLVRLISKYIEVISGEINYLSLIRDPELLDQLIRFDAKDTRLFDLVMTLGYTLLAYEIYYQHLFNWNDEMNDESNIAGVLSAFEDDD